MQLLPDKPSGKSKLSGWLQRLWQAVRERTPKDGPGYSVERQSDGWRFRFKQDRIAGGSGGGLNWRGIYDNDSSYSENDIVVVFQDFAGSPVDTSYPSPDNSGTWIAVADVSAGGSYPGADATKWARFAAPNSTGWDKLRIGDENTGERQNINGATYEGEQIVFWGGTADPVTPFGRIECDGLNFRFYLKDPANRSVDANSSDLDAGQNAKFRLIYFAEGGQVKSAKVLMTQASNV